MHIVIVTIHVKPESLAEFIQVSLDNVRNSILEAGVLRFDFIQQQEDETRFALIEVYRKPEDQEAHRQTAHYLRWRDAVTDMMAEPRVGTRYTNILPTDEDWKA